MGAALRCACAMLRGRERIREKEGVGGAAAGASSACGWRYITPTTHIPLSLLSTLSFPLHSPAPNHIAKTERYIAQTNKQNARQREGRFSVLLSLISVLINK